MTISSEVQAKDPAPATKREQVQRRDLVTTLLGVVGLGAAASAAAALAKTSDQPPIVPDDAHLQRALQGSSCSSTNTTVTFTTMYAGTTCLSNTVGVCDYQLAVVAGYAAPADGGGGLFYWDTTSSTGDDGGTIIVPSGSSTGRWQRIYSGAVNVLWFGAKWGTDCTAAIQLAYDSCWKRGIYSGTVYFPAVPSAGIPYEISSTVTIGSTSGAQNSISTLGDGFSFIVWKGTGAGPMLKYYNNSDARMSGIQLVDGTGTQSAVGLQLAGIDGVGTVSYVLNFERCTFSGFGCGLEAGDGDACASEIVLTNCGFTGCGNGFLATGGGNTLDVWFYACGFTDNAIGANLYTGGNIHFWGGGSHNNTNAVISATSWQAQVFIQGFRCEMLFPEVFVTGTALILTIDSCDFIAASPGTNYIPIQPGNSRTVIRNCVFGNIGDNFWIPVTINNATSLEMSSNVIFGPAPFDPGSHSSWNPTDGGFIYSLSGNFYGTGGHAGGAPQSPRTGIFLGPAGSGVMIDWNAMYSGTSTFASAGTISVTWTVPRSSATYPVNLTCSSAPSAGEQFWVSGKTTTGFTINSTNATSTTSIDWAIPSPCS